MGRLRVLIADDSDKIRLSLVRFLQDTFEIVGAVSTGVELVKAALALRPDVIISDLMMPGLTGLEVMQVLRDGQLSVAFVLLTAGVRDAQSWIDLGALGVVDKADLHELVTAIQAAAAGQVYLSRGAFGK